MTVLCAQSAVPPAWRVLTGFAYFVGLAAVIGFTTSFVVVLRPTLRGRSDGHAAAVRRRATTLMAGSGLLFVVTSYLQLAGRVARADNGPPFGQALAPAAILRFLHRPAGPREWVSYGTLFTVQNALIVVVAALLLSLFTPQMAARANLVAAVAAPIAVVTSLIPSVPTDLGVPPENLLDNVLTQVHIVDGMVWIGGVAMLAGLTRAARSSIGPAGHFWAEVWQRFSRLALVAVGAVLISGSWLTYRHVGNVTELWTTTFGRFLLLKFVLVLGLLVAGGLNEFVLIPRATQARSRGATGPLALVALRRFPVIVTVEVVLGLGVLVVVPFLSGSARAQAGDPAQPAATGSVFLVAVVLVATVVTSFVATSRASVALSQRESRATP